MTARLHGKKRRRKARIPVASMADIAFLLIVFFMLASNFNVDRKLPMELPKSAQVNEMKSSVTARVDIDDQGNIYLDGNRVHDADELKVGIEAMLQGAALEKRHVKLRCDAAQTKDVFGPVVEAIAEAGGVLEAVGEIE
jgi:biopolymer transport protein ExbD